MGGEPRSRPGARAAPAPLSHAQQHWWTLLRQDPEAARAHRIAVALRLQGQLDEAALKWALDRIVERHQILRTRFETQPGGVVQQRVDPPCGFALIVQDLRRQARPAHALQQAAREQARAELDPRHGPLMRGRLLRLGEFEYELLATAHPLIADDDSIGPWLHELGALYSARVRGDADPMPAPSVQYADFAARERQPAAADELQRDVRYWVEHLRGAPPLLELPADRPRPARPDLAGARLRFVIDGDLNVALQAASRRHGVTLPTMLLAAWAALLARLTGQTDLVIGTVAARRCDAAGEHSIGSYANALALRLDVPTTATAAGLLARVHELMLAARARRHAPLQHIAQALGIARGSAWSPLFQVLYSWRDAPEDRCAMHGIDIASDEPILDEAKGCAAACDLTLELRLREADVAGTLVYAVALFDPSTVERMLGYWLELLRAFAGADNSPIAQLPMLPRYERDRLLIDWNDTAVPYPADRCIHELFEAQAARTPQACAVESAGRQVSYARLDAEANRLARHLVALGVRPDGRVAIALPRSLWMVTAVLAVLKAGGAYVALDVEYPRERIQHMLADSAPVALLTCRESRSALGLCLGDLPAIDLDGVHRPWEALAPDRLDPLELGLRSTHLAYLVYTSGSTGRPKGVMIEHAGLCNLAQAQIAGFDVRADSRVLQFASFSFDASISEFLMALCSGATLCIPPPGALAGRALADELQRGRITHVTVAPSALSTLADADFPDLRVIAVAGEACGRDLVRRWAHGRRLINAYGPSETTVCASMQDCDPDQPGNPGIGGPIDNVRIYILDPHGEPVPIGVSGELYIGGAGVARGYINRPDLTAERFVADPYAPAPARMYRTGDLGRWRDDGCIEFLGRNDHQVKIRGFRIEVGEVEAALSSHPAVRQAAVLCVEDAGHGKRLMAYVAADGAPSGILADLRRHAADALPAFMQPSGYVFVERMPVTANGKLDRHALAQLEEHADATVDAQAMPRNATEQLVWNLWREILQTDRFGIADSFFDVGGDSLRAVRLHARLEETFSARLSPSLLLEARTVELQAATLRSGSLPNDSLLRIRPGRQRVPVFFVHDGFGETLVYRKLANHLHPDVPVYGLCPVAANGVAMIHTRLRDIAAGYVERIRRQQPHGPYLLGGLCAGGVIAFEMALQLQHAGETVAMLVLMEAADRSARRRIGRHAIAQVERRLHAARTDGSRTHPLAALAGLARFAGSITGLATQLAGLRLQQAVARFAARVLRHCVDRGRAPPRFARGLSVAQIYALAEHDHTPSTVRFAGDVLLVRARAGNGDFDDEPMLSVFADPCLGWDQRVSGSVHCADIDGGHYSMFQEPHVAEMARRIQQRIDALEGVPGDGSAGASAYTG